MTVQRLEHDLDGAPAAPLALVEWDDADGSRRLHTWRSYAELAGDFWRAWSALEPDSEEPVDCPAEELIWSVVSGVGVDAVLIVRALIETAPAADAVELVGASCLEDLLNDERLDGGALERIRQWVADDSRWALAASSVWIHDDTDAGRARAMADLGARRPGG